MTRDAIDPEPADEELLVEHPSDAALERASGAGEGISTLLVGSYCFTCQSESAGKVGAG